MYTVKAYDQSNFFKVVYSPTLPRDPYAGKVDRLHLDGELKHYDHRLSQSLSRSRSSIRDYILANDWQYFVTLTVRKEVVNRYSLSDILALVRPFFHELGRNKHFRYCIVPERHKDGAYHFHGVMSGIEVADLPPYAPKDALDAGYQQWPLWSQKFGFNTVGLVKDKIGVGFYVSKYITKDLCSEAVKAGQHTYYHSRGLSRSQVVGWSFGSIPLFDRCLTCHYQYCSVGYFRSEYEVVCALLEDLNMVRDYYLVDSDNDVVGLCGGDTDDPAFSFMLDQFSMFDLLAVPVENWHGDILAG